MPVTLVQPKQAWQSQIAPQPPTPDTSQTVAKAEEKPKTSDMVEPELLSIDVQKDEKPEVYASPEMMETSEKPVYEDTATKGETPDGPAVADPTLEALDEAQGTPPRAVAPPPAKDNAPGTEDLDELISFDDLKEE